MNLDELMAVWKSQDTTPLHGVNKALLHQVLRHEEEKLEEQRRRARRFMYVMSAVLLLMAALFFAILIDPNQPPTFAARLTVWDYVVGIVGVAAGATVAGAVFGLRRSHQRREEDFGDSLRDHLRRRIAQLDHATAGEVRLVMILIAATLICGKAIAILAGRIKHVPVPWSETDWPSPTAIVLILGFYGLLFFRWMPRERQHNARRKHQLEALLKELDT